MMSEIYRRYFQKSTALLYPILGVKRHKHPKPLRTYLTWENKYTLEDRKLIVVYEQKDTEAFKSFQKDVLLSHSLLDEVIQHDPEGVIIFIFDLNTYKEDYDHFVQGKYSKLSKQAKTALSDHYGMHTPEWVHIESYIFPEKYFKEYARILECDEELLKSVGELCEKYNPEEETCRYDVCEKVN